MSAATDAPPPPLRRRRWLWGGSIVVMLGLIVFAGYQDVRMLNVKRVLEDVTKGAVDASKLIPASWTGKSASPMPVATTVIKAGAEPEAAGDRASAWKKDARGKGKAREIDENDRSNATVRDEKREVDAGRPPPAPGTRARAVAGAAGVRGDGMGGVAAAESAAADERLSRARGRERGRPHSTRARGGFERR